MKIIDRKHLRTFITLPGQKIMKFLCLVLNFWPRLYLLFCHYKKHSWMLMRNFVKGINWFSTVMVSRVWNRLRTRRPVLHCGKEIAVNACVRTEILLKCSMHTSLFFLCTCTLEASHYFIQRFEATNFGERNENQTIYFIIWQFLLQQR